MMSHINRRDFLKITGVSALGLFLPQPIIRSINETRLSDEQNLPDKQNILIIILDALSAYHISLYGYQRETMPFISQLAEKAVVYHNHYAGGNFTSPGTASLLTGTLPWTHRAINHNGKVSDEFVHQNLFQSFPQHYRMAYTHNSLANTLLNQFAGDIDNYVPRAKLFLRSDWLIDTVFKKDYDTASAAWIRSLKKETEGHSYSLYFSELYKLFNKNLSEYKKDYPLGVQVTNNDNYFLLEHAIDFVINALPKAPQPFLGYFHFLPPHWPYNTRKEYYQMFKRDGYLPPRKPESLFTMHFNYDYLVKQHRFYDEFIPYVDAEFARLFDYLQTSGLIDNTCVLLTSDHGELFERGVFQHTTPLLNQSIIRVPLLIWEPGRATRQDIFQKTSAADVLPTLLHINGNQIPGWITGRVMPPYTNDENEFIFSVEAKSTPKGQPITVGTVSLIKEQYKLIYYVGYEELGTQGELIELYNVETDPAEMEDLFSSEPQKATELLSIIKAKLAEANQPYL